MSVPKENIQIGYFFSSSRLYIAADKLSCGPSKQCFCVDDKNSGCPDILSGLKIGFRNGFSYFQRSKVNAKKTNVKKIAKWFFKNIASEVVFKVKEMKPKQSKQCQLTNGRRLN